LPCIDERGVGRVDFGIQKLPVDGARAAGHERLDRLRRATKSRDFRLCLAFFVISMLCKVTLTMFPFVILLYAWWRHGRVEKEDAARR